MSFYAFFKIDSSYEKLASIEIKLFLRSIKLILSYFSLNSLVKTSREIFFINNSKRSEIISEYAVLSFLLILDFD